ncbi:30S ribosome-binding factor RbfA [Mariniblastus sp.]|nr:30S ribosome-binding factor RbfA [bacterium]MDA7925105.1 30S ribosome-binding factor RbfA [Mariniblastus sp.]MDB4368195.1 30S ribosome-binding factor RbfA [Mariniblastus sp.]MDB4481295.1 30S ribosome-binding factor RbfA [bacterium]
MSSRRVLKAAQAIREVVSMAIIADLKDPRIKDVTVTLVEVAPDMRQAKVHVSVMGDESKQGLCIRGLQSSAGYLQQKVGNRIDTRYTPRLQFVLDKGIQHALLVTRILEEVLPAEREQQEQAASNSVDSGVGESEAAGTADSSESPSGTAAVDETHGSDRESPDESVEGPV